MASKPIFKQLQPPRQRQLYTDPITDIITNKKIKLQTNKDAFIFFLTKAQPHIIFLEYKNTRTRINKLLKPYTQEEDTKQQFIKLLEEPQIIQDRQTTLFIIEVIYIMSFLFNIDLTRFIIYISLDNLINYYLIQYNINTHKQEQQQ